jgi:hypothetical protein
MKLLPSLIFALMATSLEAQLPAPSPLDTILPVRGLCLGAPSAKDLERFVEFIDEECSQLNVNLLVIRVGTNYRYQSRPELSNPNELTKEQVKEIVAAARKHGIRIVPMVNLLGHQSWHGNLGKLLTVYPEFDETPWVDLPTGKYEWPNEDGLYCKSYCPLHDVVFDLVDEITEVFVSIRLVPGYNPTSPAQPSSSQPQRISALLVVGTASFSELYANAEGATPLVYLVKAKLNDSTDEQNRS